MRKKINFFNDNINYIEKQEQQRLQKMLSKSQSQNENIKEMQLYKKLLQKINGSQQQKIPKTEQKDSFSSYTFQSKINQSYHNTQQGEEDQGRKLLAQVDHKIDNLELEIFKSSQKYHQISKTVILNPKKFIFQDYKYNPESKSTQQRTKYTNQSDLQQSPIRKNTKLPNFIDQTQRVNQKITKKYLMLILLFQFFRQYLPNNASLNRKLQNDALINIIQLRNQIDRIQPNQDENLRPYNITPLKTNYSTQVQNPVRNLRSKTTQKAGYDFNFISKKLNNKTTLQTEKKLLSDISQLFDTSQKLTKSYIRLHKNLKQNIQINQQKISDQLLEQDSQDDQKENLCDEKADSEYSFSKMSQGRLEKIISTLKDDLTTSNKQFYKFHSKDHEKHRSFLLRLSNHQNENFPIQNLQKQYKQK